MTLDDELKAIFNVTSLYEVLGIPCNAPHNEIKRAYLRRCLEWHPDKTSDPKEKELSTKKFHILKSAYQTLCDRETRNEYDEIYSCTSTDKSDQFLRCDAITIYQTREIEDYFYYDCRCSGLFKLSKQCLASHVPDPPNIFIVECDSCSEMIKITL